MKVSDYIADFLYAQGVEQVFEVIGGMITHLIDSLHQQGRIRIVSVHHEQAAAFAAEGAARVSGVPGVAMATSGPGATNLLTGIGSCYFDSTPAVFITGQVNRHEQRGTRAVRQLGFQETDIVAIAGPLTKAAWRVESAQDIPELLRKAFEIALSGRPGPVLIDIPMDVQREDIQAEIGPRLTLTDAHELERAPVEAMLDALASSQRPLLLAGGGVGAVQGGAAFRRLAEHLNIPVVGSLMAIDSLPYEHPLRVGMIGSYGNRWANLAIGRSDFMLVLGSRLDVRQTGSETDAFSAGRAIYQVDCDAGEMNNRVRGCHTILADLRSFFEDALEIAQGRTFPQHAAWREEIAELRRSWPDTHELKGIQGINPNLFMHQLCAGAADASAFVVDVGQHQMWAAQSLELREGQRFMTSGGMGAMGFALPAALGVAVARPQQPVVMIAGDGAFQLNLQEMQTVQRNQLPIKMVIINNGCHGMVRQFQQSYFGERYQSTFWGYSAPDFARVAESYGIRSLTVDDPDGVPHALGHMWSDSQAPFLLQVMVDTFANAYPKIAFGRPITEMEPFATPLEMEGT